jgi:hypothetical protein
MQEAVDALIEQLKKVNEENENLKFRLSLVSGQSFCSKAEAFVRWLEDENLNSFWRKDELIYYWTERDGEDIPAEVVLARFEEEQKHFR